MLFEDVSTSAFAPPPAIAIHEPVDRRGSGSARARPWAAFALQNHSSATYTAENVFAQMFELSKYASVSRELAGRLLTLKFEAQLDEVQFSAASEADFVGFLIDAQPSVRPALFLNDNGNLRAMWRNADGEQVALQFLGGGYIQFVIFKRRSGADLMARISGLDTTVNILSQIRGSGALTLIRG